MYAWLSYRDTTSAGNAYMVCVSGVCLGVNVWTQMYSIGLRGECVKMQKVQHPLLYNSLLYHPLLYHPLP